MPKKENLVEASFTYLRDLGAPVLSPCSTRRVLQYLRIEFDVSLLQLGSFIETACYYYFLKVLEENLLDVLLENES